ncbi:flavin reductase [Candidatus Neomicrothrix sp.]|uniref:flavin reductase n=1 Tax=Candidatus Neomicrothrix sp. TaxID=2719034 RepID=UPI00259826C2|nr:flavin reductase [Candidatus Microthrix sp.]HMS49018.1 flavin reductase [Candidatus Microthrix sp.]
MIDQGLKRCLGQMIKGVQVVGAVHDGVARAYCSHWVCQVSFESPILLASVSPKHDTHPLIVGSGRFTVSILAADQIGAAQYFSYPGRKFRYVADELLTVEDGRVGVPDSIAWLDCEVLDRGADGFLPRGGAGSPAAWVRLARPAPGAPPIVGGESGVAGLAGLLQVADDPELRESVGIDATSRVLVINTEGATDPGLYTALVGITPEQVLA